MLCLLRMSVLLTVLHGVNMVDTKIYVNEFNLRENSIHELFLCLLIALCIGFIFNKSYPGPLAQLLALIPSCLLFTR